MTLCCIENTFNQVEVETSRKVWAKVVLANEMLFCLLRAFQTIGFFYDVYNVLLPAKENAREKVKKPASMMLTSFWHIM